jgi:uncharacterized protein YdhG (YjbR/CyaY superfamily)
LLQPLILGGFLVDFNTIKYNMEVSMSSKNETKKSEGFTHVEKAAMKERAKELKAEARANKKREKGEKDVFEKIAEMPEPERSMAQRLHEIITENAPDLWPRTWYGMPAYAKDNKVICFFEASSKYDSRYSTLGFQPDANLDNGAMWPTAFALQELTTTEEARIVELVKKAVS